MHPVKIIFFDIDGTLVDHATGRISPKTLEALHRLQDRNIKICIATGRPNASLPDFGDLHFDAMSTFNGSVCYSGENIIFSAPIPPASVQKIIDNAAALGRPVSVAVWDRLVANGIEQDLADYYTMAGLVLTVAEDFEETCRQDVFQIMMGCRQSDHPAIIRGAEDVKITFSWERASDVLSVHGGKGASIQKILDYFGLDASEAMAFGDSKNDEDMLHAVGTGVAMGNATEQLKALADDICGPVSEDGIYHYCLQQGLI